ncbi:MAG: hypothetical protein M3137_11495, partial [Actinomycetota bacterium]|nr:hypothetical protein [Actinomycetota bacterium]
WAVRCYALRAADNLAFLGLGNMTGVDTPLCYYLDRRTQGGGRVRGDPMGHADRPGGGLTNAYEGHAQVASRALVTVEATRP